MKTYRNQNHERHLLLVSNADPDSGDISYSQRLLTPADLLYFRRAEADGEPFEFSPSRELNTVTEWYSLIPPQSSLTVPTHAETFALCASRTGDFGACQPRQYT